MYLVISSWEIWVPHLNVWSINVRFKLTLYCPMEHFIGVVGLTMPRFCLLGTLSIWLHALKLMDNVGFWIPSQYKDRFTGITISIIKLKDHLIFIMEIPIFLRSIAKHASEYNNMYVRENVLRNVAWFAWQRIWNKYNIRQYLTLHRLL